MRTKNVTHIFIINSIKNIQVLDMQKKDKFKQ